MVRDQQIKRLFDMRNKHDYPYQAVDAAGISHKTAYKYLKSGTLPNHCRIDHPGRRGDCGRKHAIVENCLAPATSHTLAGFNSTGADKLVVAVCGEGSGAVLTGVTLAALR